MSKQLKPGQLCTIDGEIYRCSKRVTSPCLECYYHYGENWHKTPCEKWASRRSIPTCTVLFGVPICAKIFGHLIDNTSFPILVSMCKK